MIGKQKVGYCGFCSDKLYEGEFIVKDGEKFCNELCYEREMEDRKNEILDE